MMRFQIGDLHFALGASCDGLTHALNLNFMAIDQSLRLVTFMSLGNQGQIFAPCCSHQPAYTGSISSPKNKYPLRNHGGKIANVCVCVFPGVLYGGVGGIFMGWE